MRRSVFIVIQCLIALAIVGVIYIHQDRVIVLKEPPESIAEWYKPQNKRQVWLHTMFKLRREMLAVEIYAEAEDGEHLQKWAEKLNVDYNKLAEMTPEWQKKLDVTAMARVLTSAKESRYSDVTQALAELDKNCRSCHTDFRAVTAAIYRAPDFTDMKIDDATSLTSHMGALSKQVNRIKIAFVDDRGDAALSALSDLTKGMKTLGGVCANCHKKPSIPYPDEKMMQAAATLEQSLKTGSLREKGEALGALAVTACAKCHGTHRLSNDAKRLLKEQKSWGDLLKH